jgi:hypothetical protein
MYSAVFRGAAVAGGVLAGIAGLVFVVWSFVKDFGSTWSVVGLGILFVFLVGVLIFLRMKPRDED